MDPLSLSLFFSPLSPRSQKIKTHPPWVNQESSAKEFEPDLGSSSVFNSLSLSITTMDLSATDVLKLLGKVFLYYAAVTITAGAGKLVERSR